MKIKKIKSKNYTEHNNQFLTSTQALRDKIFQTKSTGTINYEQSTNDYFREKLDLRKDVPTPVVDAQEIQDSIKKYDGIGPVENALISTILSTDYLSIVLPGALGSGKSALCNFVLDHILRLYGPDMCMLINIDINLGYTDRENYKKVLREFNKDFTEKLKSSFIKVFTKKDIMKVFIEKIHESLQPTWEAAFLDFKIENVDKKHKNSKNDWENLASKQQIIKLFDWISNKSHSIEDRIRLYGYIGRFLRNYFSEDFLMILFLDNIDGILDEAQSDILYTILGFNNSSGIKGLIPMRQTTFGWVIANAPFSWCNFKHYGPPPLDIIKKRIEHFFDENNQKTYTGILDKINITGHLVEFKKRLKQFNDIIMYPKSRLSMMISAISGESIRRGLFICERIFKNNTLKFDHENVHEGDLQRALLVSLSPNSTFNLDDSLIINLFVSPEKNKPDLLLIRIIQLVYQAHLINEVITIKKLIFHLKAINNWSHEEIRVALNYLLQVRKRIIFIDGISLYRDTRELFTSINDKIYLTSTGKKYFEYLLEDLVYAQEAFIGIEWDSSEIPSQVNFDSDLNAVLDRFSFIRKALREFIDMDEEQTTHYVLSNVRNDGSLFAELICVKILCNLGRSVKIILNSYKEPGVVEKEILDWDSLISFSISKEKKIFGERIEILRKCDE